MGDKEFRIIVIISLIIGITTLSICFIVISRILIIDYNDETTGRTNIFENAIVYSEEEKEKASVVAQSLKNVTNANPGYAKSSTWSGINFTIDSNSPSASAEFKAYITNQSRDYDAYLRTITSIDKTIECTPLDDTSYELVQGVCKDMSVTVEVSGVKNNGSAKITYEKPAGADFSLGKPTQIKLAKNSSQPVTIRFDYSTNKPLPDGRFRVKIPTILLGYTSVIIGK